MTLVANGFVLQNGTPYLAQIPQPTYIQMPGACLCAPSSFTRLKKYVLCMCCLHGCLHTTCLPAAFGGQRVRSPRSGVMDCAWKVVASFCEDGGDKWRSMCCQGSKSLVKVIRRLCVSWLGNVTQHKIFNNSKRLARYAGAALNCQMDRWSCVPPKVGAAHSSPPK